MLSEQERGTPRPRLEDELRGATARYRAILASTLDPVVTIDARGVIQAASDSVRRVFGWTPDDLVGQNVNILMPEPHRSSHDDYLAEYRRTGVTNILGRTREFQAARKDGTTFPIELAVSRVDLPDSEHPLFTGIIRDITERKKAEDELRQHREHLTELVAERTRELRMSHEQLRQADRLASIGTLAAGLGHDMNNVLLPIRSRLDVLETSDLPPDSLRQLDSIRKSVEYLQHLSDSLHLLALDPSDAEASPAATDLSSWWEQVAPLLGRSVPKPVRLAMSLPGNLPPVAVAPHRLTQAVLNLLVNAGEAVGDDGKVRLWAEALDGGRSVRFSVSDNGEGMTPEVSQRALDPFFTTKKRGLGTGLGLALVHGIVKSAGGAVTIDSEPGHGTTIGLTLPAKLSKLQRDPRVATPALAAVVSVTDRRLSSFASTLLENAGFHVQLDESADPGSSRLWITDPSAGALRAAPGYLADSSRQIIVVGGASRAWADLGADVVSDPQDFETLRDHIHQAAERLTGAGSS